MPTRLGIPFFAQSALRLSAQLPGTILVKRVGNGIRRARLVEVEAYVGPKDLASHSSKGRTVRTEVMFGAAGRAYVYFIYGMHWCFNAVTREAGHGSAVLVRALEPLSGLALMRRRREIDDDVGLTSGPARLCEAFAIGRSQNGVRLDRGPLRILQGLSVPDESVLITPRIGIRKAADWPLRFLVKQNPFVSKG